MMRLRKIIMEKFNLSEQDAEKVSVIIYQGVAGNEFLNISLHIAYLYEGVWNYILCYSHTLFNLYKL